MPSCTGAVLTKRPGKTVAADRASLLERGWYRDNWLTRLLAPLAWLFAAISRWRRRVLSRAAQRQSLPVPVIVVGNISVGGTGKTPLLITLVETLRRDGFRPGVISRGYGGKAPNYPFMVGGDTPPQQGGDEPVLIASQCQCPVVVDPDRLQAAHYLLTHSDCNVILSDDGLQHYRLPRDIEIAVVDGQRGFGNRRLLPAGPLREPVSRLDEVDFVVCNGQPGQTVSSDLQATEPVIMELMPDRELRPLAGGEPLETGNWHPQRREVNAVRGHWQPTAVCRFTTADGLYCPFAGFSRPPQLPGRPTCSSTFSGQW